jgi:nucleoside-diphosphate-sugar epimerase
MSIFLTGATGYLGGYVLSEILAEREAGHPFLLTRARTRDEAVKKLWKALQLHMTPSQFEWALGRVRFVPGDLHADGLGIDDAMRRRVADGTTSVLHIAASLNRMSAKACFNANLRGTLSVLELAKTIADGRGGLERFSFVSTTAVSGRREHEVVAEDDAVSWDRSDYDPYARTKKLAEDLVHRLLPAETRRIIFRPPTVMGDSRFPETTQFDMVRAYAFFVDLPVVPLDPEARQDIVNADFVGKAIARIHLKPEPKHDAYHLSAGTGAETAMAIAEALSEIRGRRPIFAPRLVAPFERALALAGGTLSHGSPVSRMANMLKVFLPYVTNDVVFDNTRVVEETGLRPVPFTAYCGALYRWAKANDFTYPYAPLPEEVARPVAEAAP